MSARHRRRVVLGVLSLAWLALLTTGSPAQAEDWPVKGRDIGAVPVDLDASHLLYGQAMRVFIATGSDNPNCLVTLREASDPWNLRPAFCGPRTFEGRKGVLLSVFFFQDATPDVVVGLTLYQRGARYYAAPVLYPGF